MHPLKLNSDTRVMGCLVYRIIQFKRVKSRVENIHNSNFHVNINRYVNVVYFLFYKFPAKMHGS